MDQFYCSENDTITHDVFPIDLHFPRYAVLRHSVFRLVTGGFGIEPEIGNFEGYLFIHVTCSREAGARKSTFFRSKD